VKVAAPKRRKKTECRKPGQDHPKPPQSHPKATPRPYTRHRLRSTKPPQGPLKAPPKPPQGSTKATSRLHQSHPKAPPKPGSLGQERHSRWPAGAGASPKSSGRVNLETAVNATPPSRNRSQTSFNAETQRAQSNAEEKTIPFHLSLRSSANLCVSALIQLRFPG